MQEIGGLVEGVGAVRHDEARNGLVLGELVDGLCHLDPVGAGHFGRADVAHLHAANVCKLFDAGHACEQRGDVEFARGVSGGLPCVSGACDGAARREQDDGGKPWVLVVGDGDGQARRGLLEAVAVRSCCRLVGVGRACCDQCGTRGDGACDELPAAGDALYAVPPQSKPCGVVRGESSQGLVRPDAPNAVPGHGR